MKLLIYSNFFAPSVGGVETVVLSLATGLAGLRTAEGEPEFQVTVVTQTGGEGFDDRTLPFAVVRKPGLLQLFRSIRRCDLLHVAGPAIAALVFGKILGKPVVLEHHGFQVICPNGQLLIERQGIPCPGHFMAGRHHECWKCNSGQGWLTSARWWLLTFVRRFLASRVQANVTPTKWLGDVLGLPAMEHIAHGLAPRGASARQTAPENPPLIVFQGRLVTTKGVETLLEAARRLLEEDHTFELLVAGDGPDRTHLESLAGRPPLAGRVRFVGRLEAAELECELARADVAVVPSVGGEVFGLVVAENMQRGLPVVASDLGAFLEVLGTAGVVFRAGDSVELSRRLKELIQDPSRREILGTAARRRIEEAFPLRRMIEGHAALYRKVVREVRN